MERAAISGHTIRPTPLASIRLRRQLPKDDDSHPLCLSRIKRRLVGLHIAFCKNKCKLDILSSNSFCDGSRVRRIFCVESLTPRLRMNDNSKKSSVYVVLPSTRITLMLTGCATEGGDSSDVETHSDSLESCLAAITVSGLTQLLIHDLRSAGVASSESFGSKTFLLSGPPGVGKTFAVKQTYQVRRGEARISLLSVRSLLSLESPSAVARMLKGLFEKACNRTGPWVIFVDECDTLLSSDNAATVLASLLDRLAHPVSQSLSSWKHLVVIAATNSPNRIPLCLRETGRFDKEMVSNGSTAEFRYEALKALITTTAQGCRRDEWLQQTMVDGCSAFTVADLVGLVHRVVMITLKEGKEFVSSDLFCRAKLEASASIMSGLSLLSSSVTRWGDIVGDLGGALENLRQAVDWTQSSKRAFQDLGLQFPKGILLFGPPGCAKTTLARAAAGYAGLVFIAPAPSDVFASSFVGEAEGVVRRAFQLARSRLPCVLFFDEIDSVVGGNEFTLHSGHKMTRTCRGASVESRVLSTFLNEMDGVDSACNDCVIVLAATNRPWSIDKALLRSGRFDRIIYIPPPDYVTLLAIFKKYCGTNDIGDGGFIHLARHGVSLSVTGAEAMEVCKVASVQAMKEVLSGASSCWASKVTFGDMRDSLLSITPLLSDCVHVYSLVLGI